MPSPRRSAAVAHATPRSAETRKQHQTALELHRKDQLEVRAAHSDARRLAARFLSGTAPPRAPHQDILAHATPLLRSLKRLDEAIQWAEQSRREAGLE